MSVTSPPRVPDHGTTERYDEPRSRDSVPLRPLPRRQRRRERSHADTARGSHRRQASWPTSRQPCSADRVARAATPQGAVGTRRPLCGRWSRRGRRGWYLRCRRSPGARGAALDLGARGPRRGRRGGADDGRPRRSPGVRRDGARPGRRAGTSARRPARGVGCTAARHQGHAVSVRAVWPLEAARTAGGTSGAGDRPPRAGSGVDHGAGTPARAAWGWAARGPRCGGGLHERRGHTARGEPTAALRPLERRGRRGVPRAGDRPRAAGSGARPRRMSGPPAGARRARGGLHERRGTRPRGPDGRSVAAEGARTARVTHGCRRSPDASGAYDRRGE